MSGAPRRHVRYDEAFKADAVRLWKTSHRSAREVAKELGISAATLYAWGRESRPRGSDAAATQMIRELEEEIGRLRADNLQLRQQCETLQKTISILAEFPKGELRRAQSLFTRPDPETVEKK